MTRRAPRSRSLVHVVIVSALLAGCAAAPPIEGAADVRDPLTGPGQELYWRGEYDSARVAWSSALVEARAAGDSLGVANLLTWVGLAAYRSGNNAEARDVIEYALELRLELGESRELARSYIALGLLAQDENRLADAQRLFEHARMAAVTAAEADMEAAAAGNLGLVHAYLGDLDTAASMLRLMQRGGRVTGDRRLTANALNNLAMVSVWAGDPVAALAALDTARSLYRELDYPLGEQYALGQLATARYAMGDYDAVLAVMDTALAHSRRHGMPDHEAENLALLGFLYAELGDDRRALRHLDEAATLSAELGLAAELGNVLRRAARSHYSVGSTDRAFTDAKRALDAHRAAGLIFDEIDDLLVLADLYGRSGHVVEAVSSLRSARLLAQQVDSRSARSTVALAEARRAELAGSPRQVLAAVARTHAETLASDFRVRMDSHILAARAYAALGLLDSAAVAGRAAVNAAERVRGGLAADELRGSFIAASAALYGDVVLILLRLGRAEEAFAVADAARSRDLLDRLTTARAPDDGGEVDAAAAHDLAEAELLLRRIDVLLSQLRQLDATPQQERGGGVVTTADDIEERIGRLREEYEALSIRTAQRHSRTANMMGMVRVERAAVSAALAPDEVLLHYTLTPRELVVFVIRGDRLETVRQPVTADDLASRIRLLRELQGDRHAGLDAGIPVARGLHDILIAPLRRDGLIRGAERLIIVPHGILEQLPFAALQDPATGRFLIEDHFISYLLSANVLPSLREGSARPAVTTRRISVFAPFPTALPGTRAEATVAHRSGARAGLHLDRRASESAVRRALLNSEIVHIASHGVLNVRNPMFSRIELARGAPGSSADDGRLEVHEVLRMLVNSTLVVLSGCETGVAEDWSGDALRQAGIATLGQAFLHAGARSVMATLWRIPDQGSAQLVEHFYQYIDDGDVARALALAQRALIRHPTFGVPYYWAGFMVVGDGRLASRTATGRRSARSEDS